MGTVGQQKIRTYDAFAAADGQTVDPLGIFLVFVRKRRTIGIVTLAGLLLGIAVALLLKPNFTATAIILPPTQQSSSAGLMSQLGSLAALGGGASALGIKTPADMYVGILQSRTIADNLITKYQLQSIYKQKNLLDTRAALKAHTEIEAGKDGLIHISVVDHDQRRASDLANGYVDQLYGMNSNLAITEAAQRRLFFDQQLDTEKKALAAAEEALRTTQQKTGLIQLTGQAQMIIGSIAQLRAQIASREVEMQSLRVSSTDQNPNVIRLQEEISTMQAQLTHLEDDRQHQENPGDIALPAGRVAADSLEYARKYREVKYHETLFDLLSRQYEAARIDEAKSAPIIQVIDRAVPPDKKSGPHGSLIVPGFGLAALFLSCLAVYVQYGFARIWSNPSTRARWAASMKSTDEQSL
jgi:tyrosine-protein kinase Etk/Wzc